MGWPTSSEFAHFLIASGMMSQSVTALQGFLDLDGAIEAAVDRWNDLTGYWPFLSTGDATEYRDFASPNSGVLDFDSGLVAFTSLTTANEYLAFGSLQGGEEQLNVRDFRLQPMDAPQKKKPWTWAQTGWWGAGGGIIRVTGEWGYCNEANLPEAARRAVMALAAQQISPQIEAVRRQGGLVKLQRGDETKQWGAEVGQLEQTWQSMVEGALGQGYVRIRVA